MDANGAPLLTGPGYETLRLEWEPLDREPSAVTIIAAMVGAFGKHEIVVEITDASANVVGRKVESRDDIPPDPTLKWVTANAVLFVPTQAGPHVLSLRVDGHQLVSHRLEVVSPPQSTRGH